QVMDLLLALCRQLSDSTPHHTCDGNFRLAIDLRRNIDMDLQVLGETCDFNRPIHLVVGE
ncbi:hypothetical protein N9Z49_03425, partial [Akkermansiaceae bacterium]|nr:hypothetical protein [Akkermansiaceae bacterium]